MVELLEQFDFSDGCDGEAVLLVVHKNLLQRHDLPGLLRPCLGNLAECTFAQLGHVIVVLNAGAAVKSLSAIVEAFERLRMPALIGRHPRLSLAMEAEGRQVMGTKAIC